MPNPVTIPGIPQRFARPPPLPVVQLQPSVPPAPEHVKLGWRGMSLGIPMSLVTALVTALVTHWATPATLPESDELRSTVRDIAADVRELRHDARDTHDQLAIERAYTRRDIPLIAAVVERGCSAKFAWHDGLRPAEPDWLPKPLTGSPEWQPALAMLAPPAD